MILRAATSFLRWGMVEIKLQRWSIFKSLINVEISSLKPKPYINVDFTLKTQLFSKLKASTTFQRWNNFSKDEVYTHFQLFKNSFFGFFYWGFTYIFYICSNVEALNMMFFKVFFFCICWFQIKLFIS